jgi:CheY-like chemotaxis protein
MSKTDNVDNAASAIDVKRKQNSCTYYFWWMIQMLKMDGKRIDKYIRNHGEPNQCPVIIVLTAHATLYVRKSACMENGMNDYLSKPFILMYYFENYIII